MKIKICIIILLLFSLPLFAQDKEGRKVELADGSFVLPEKYPEVTKPVKPVYPREAILQDIQGKVYVRVTINESGKVEGVKIAKGISASLNKSALEAAKKMEFSPAVYNGKKVKVSIAVPVNFVLDPDKQGPKLDMGVPAQDAKARANVRNLLYGGDNQSQPQQDIKIDRQNKEGEEPDPSLFVPVEKNPEPIQLAKPIYPEIAKRAGITGVVVLRILVSTEGKPIKIALIKADNEMFVEPSKEAAMKTIFSPAIQNGKPIACWVNIPFRFSTNNKDGVPGKSLFECDIHAGAYKYYPKEISDRFIEGNIKLLVQYTADGELVSSEFIESTNSILDQKAIEFVKEAMKPASYKNGLLRNINGKEVYEFKYNIYFGFGRDEKYVLDSTNPDYPAEAKDKKLSGLVDVEFVYDKDGKLLNTNYLHKTNSMLDNEALKLFNEKGIAPKSIKKQVSPKDNELKIIVNKVIEFKLQKK